VVMPANSRLLRITRPKGRSAKSRSYASSDGFSGTRDGATPSPAPGLIEVMIVQKNGKNIATAPRMTTRCRPMDPKRRGDSVLLPRIRVVVSAIVHPPLLPADLDDRDGEHHHKQQPGEGGCFAGAPV